LETELSVERQIEILGSALEASSTPVEFYKNIGPYLSYLTLELLDTYKSRMWVKYLRGIRERLSFKDLDVAQIRKALAQMEGAFYLLEDEIKWESLSEEEKEVLQEVEAAIAALRTYKEITYFMRDMEQDSGTNPSQVSLSLVKARKLVKSLEKEGVPDLPGLPAPRELWKRIKALVQREWLEAALAREEGFIKGMRKDIARLSEGMSKAKEKGRNIEVEELEGLLERYFSLIIRYNRAVKEYKRLERRFHQQYPAPLEVHREKLEEIRLHLDRLKVTKFLAILISGRELLNP